jgi:hypothetical protein
MRARAVRRLLALSIAALAAVAAVAQVSAAGENRRTAEKLVDRTLVCAAGFHGGARVLYLRAQAAYGQGARLDWLAGVYVSTAGNPDPNHRNYRPSLAGVNAGWPPPPRLASGGLGFDIRRCAASRQRVDLSHRGLVGGAASKTGDDYTCVVPKRVLIRLRADFRTPVELRLASRGRLYGAEGRIEHGQIAIRTLAGKPLVYGDVREAGRARLFTTGACG